MSKKPSNLLRSNSYLSMLRPYLKDCEKYATCPPINMQMIEANRRGSGAAVVNKCTTVAKRIPTTKTILISTTTTKPSNNSNSMRAFNFNVNPLWHRHSNPHQRKSQQNFELQLRQRGGQDNNEKPHHQHQQHKKHKSPLHVSTATKTTALVPFQIPCTTKCECDRRLDKSRCHNAAIMQRSLPIFEVLPPLIPTNSQHLLYQNSYLLDGVNYNYNEEQAAHTGSGDVSGSNGKLKLNYAKFFKSITTKTKPSDGDVIFGNAKVLLARKGGWEGSRIEWLLELERRQDMRRKRYMQQQQTHPATTLEQLNEYDDDDKSIFDICCFPCGCQMLVWQMN